MMTRDYCKTTSGENLYIVEHFDDHDYYCDRQGNHVGIHDKRSHSVRLCNGRVLCSNPWGEDAAVAELIQCIIRGDY